MYNALMAIGALDSKLHSPAWCLDRTKEIVSAALKEMHVEHTEEVRDALGIGFLGPADPVEQFHIVIDGTHCRFLLVPWF
jgi:hypothetical protein